LAVLTLLFLAFAVPASRRKRAKKALWWWSLWCSCALVVDGKVTIDGAGRGSARGLFSTLDGTTGTFFDQLEYFSTCDAL
jgi:hypothetical protein